MTAIFAPAALIAPEARSAPAAPNESSARERGATFGPALSEARERLSAPEARSSAPPDRRPARTERPARPVERSNDRTTDTPDPVTHDDVEQSDDDATVEETSEVTEDESPIADPATPVDAAVSPNAPSAAAAVMAATVHPTAKGAGGESDPSIDPTIAGVASPDQIAATSEHSSVVDATIGPLDADVDVDAVAGGGEPAPAEMGRQAALTSLDHVRDVDLGLAERIQPAEAEAVEGPAIAAGDTTRAAPISGSQSSEAELGVPVRGPAEGAAVERSDTAETAVEAVPDELPDASAVDGPSIDARPLERAADAAVAPGRNDNAGSVVVLAGEATVATDGPRPTAAAAPQTAGPMETAEANLWEDVRTAFDRVRSTGDGQEVRIRLRPAELGELLVQVRTQGDHVAVRLVASSAAAQQTLIDDRTRLAAELARAGFDEGSVDIGQQNAGDSNRRGSEGGTNADGEQNGRSFGNVGGLDRVGTARGIFERREPIRTESGFRPGRSIQSTINLTL